MNFDSLKAECDEIDCLDSDICRIVIGRKVKMKILFDFVSELDGLIQRENITCIEC